MTPLAITSQVFECIPNMIIISGTVNIGKPDIPAIKKYLQKSWEKLGGEVQVYGLKTHPLISQWRESLKQAGISMKKYPLSIEAIAKRAQSSNAPFSINPIVDTYNAISMDLVLPFGTYDLDDMNGELELRTAKEGEKFYCLGSGNEEETEKEEIVYSDNTDILTRQFLWRQAEKCKITPETKRMVFVCELLEEMGETILSDAENLIKERFFTLLDSEIENLKILRK